jgi:RsiW-degrading membrane proteinase PrsW (M82 family)
MTNLPPAKKPRYVGRSTLLPFLGDRSGFLTKTHIIPIVAIILAATLVPMAHDGVFSSIPVIPSPYVDLPGLNGAVQVTWILGGLVAFLIMYYVYMLCGRRKPWWLLLGVVVVMGLLLAGPLGYIVGSYNEWADPNNTILGAYIGPGLNEELAKALPVFFLAWVGRRKTRLAQRIGVLEPLDGILIGVAAGTAFTLLETLGQYSLMPLHEMGPLLDDLLTQYCGQAGTNGDLCNDIVQYSSGAMAYHTIVIAMMRIISDFSGHLAYAGVFGYFIGLAVIRPASAVRIVLLGWASAAALHGTWDAVNFSIGHGLSNGEASAISVLVAVAAYVFLASCILKGRKLSPTRFENFATVGGPSVARYAPPPPPPVPAAVPASDKAQPAAAALVLKIGTVTRPVAPGTSIEPLHLGLAGAGRGNGPIAEIVSNPNDPAVLGLRNLSDLVYRATMPDGKTIEISRGQTARLAAGVVVDFGGIEGSVQPV